MCVKEDVDRCRASTSIRTRVGAFPGGRFYAVATRAYTPMMTLSALHAVIPLRPPFRIVETIKIMRTGPCDAREGILIVDRCYRRCQDVAQDLGR